MKNSFRLMFVKSVVLFSILMTTFGLSPALAADEGQILRLGTMSVGTSVNTAGIGFAGIINENTALDIKVVPTTSQAIWVPMMIKNEIELGVGNLLSFENAYFAKAAYAKIAKKMKVKTFPIRQIAKGAPLHLGFLVRGDSPYKKISDLKGAKVPLYPKGLSSHMHTLALLANGDLTANDVKDVPVSNPLEATRALSDGRADAVDVAITAPMIMEPVTKLKARFLPLDPSPEAVKRMATVNHQYYANIPKGADPNVIKEPTPLLGIDMVFVASKNLSEDTVYAITKAIWENRAALAKKPVLNKWEPEKFAVSARIFVPYHLGAIKFYKEIGMWDAEADKIQNDLLSREPK